MGRVEPEGGEAFGDPEADGVHVVNRQAPNDIKERKEKEKCRVLHSIDLRNQ